MIQQRTLNLRIKEYLSYAVILSGVVYHNYHEYVTMDMEVVNTKNVYELELVKAAGSVNNSELQEIVDGLKSDVKDLPDLTRLTFNKMMSSMEEVIDDVVKPIEDVLLQIQQLRNELDVYQKSTRMDTDFFMLVYTVTGKV